MAGIRSQCIVFGLNTTTFQRKQIQLFHKSLKIKRSLPPRWYKLIRTDILQNIIDATSALELPIDYRALYLFAFYSFLQISSILSHTVIAFVLHRIQPGSYCGG